jgi:hypothetical protein
VNCSAVAAVATIAAAVSVTTAVVLGRELRRARHRLIIRELAARCADEVVVTIEPAYSGRFYWRVSPIGWSSNEFTADGFAATEAEAEDDAAEAAVVLQAEIVIARGKP